MSNPVATLPASRVLPLYLHGLAFFGGFNVMLLEMCAFRVLQTTFGSSIYVTGLLLALVMIALSAGYYLGGWFSQRFSSLEFLLGMLLSAVGYVVLTGVLLAEPLLDFFFGLRDSFTGELTGHLVPPAAATLVLYAVPMLALSQVSPYLIRLLAVHSSELGSVGATAGKLMAVSNVGSIIGTSLPSFVLIPLFGVQKTLAVFIVAELLIIALGFLVARRRMAVVALASVALVGAVAVPALRKAPTPFSYRGAQVVFDSESLYGNVKILRSIDEDGDERLEYMPSRGYIHSTVYPGKPLKDQFTTAYVNVGLARGARRYLVLGTALGGVVAAIQAAVPDARITTVEIDPLVVDLAKRFVPSLQQPAVTHVVKDARLFLREDTGEYDYIVVDIFSGEQIPAHCVSQEFFALAYARLAPGGVMQMNTNLWDFHVTTGLEQPEPFVPVRHVHSALLRVGFASLFQNDFFEHGHLYAFREKTSAEQLYQQLERMALDEQVEPNLRASVAMARLALVPIPDERRELKPFSDSWVPEAQLHLKGNFEMYLSALSRARRLPEWNKTVVEPGDTQLRLISARHYAEIGEAFSPTMHGYSSYMKAEGGEAYCRDVLAWVARTSRESLYPELARYLHTRVIHDCEQRFQAGEAEAKGTVASFRRYVGAAVLVDENEGARAVPSLTEILRETSST
ncbi:fused MFS/spermidine synthase [Archangium violaceum]|uniref:fused MFS/spermidine synthase n=1 Tax=Archangium violaceum TaxID=83451 RepID=UPI00194E5C26|nr:fused MFS/spermidine synthase [Archangium violaceum]QRO01827.1 fused MFS/spermidine synthase [Archangium violaceum]